MGDQQSENTPKHGAEHLAEHQWVKGQSGNPGGRPKGSVSLITELKRQLRENPDDAEDIVANLLHMAKQDDDRALRAIAQVFDRIDGTPVQRVEQVAEHKMKLVHLMDDEESEDAET